MLNGADEVGPGGLHATAGTAVEGKFGCRADLPDVGSVPLSDGPQGHVKHTGLAKKLAKVAIL